MKKKIFIGIAMSLFTVATVFNMNLLNENGAGDVSLDAVSIMAKAQSEGPLGMICYGGVQYTGGTDAAVLCSGCQLKFGYIGIGYTGSCN